MPVEQRKKGEYIRWGYRFRWRGKFVAAHRWDNPDDAWKAELERKADLAAGTSLQCQEVVILSRDSLGKVVEHYLQDSRDRGRSHWRVEALRLNFRKFVVPAFGKGTPNGNIGSGDIEKLIKAQTKRLVRERPVSANTIFHIASDLRPLFTWEPNTRNKPAANCSTLT